MGCSRRHATPTAPAQTPSGSPSQAELVICDKTIETTLDEVKVHQWAHPKPLRSQSPREVVQEIYGLLLAHLAIRTMMHHAALRQALDPDRLSFTGALRVLHRAIPRAQRTSSELLPLFVPADRVSGGTIACAPPATESLRRQTQDE
jgi:hypothetical protein